MKISLAYPIGRKSSPGNELSSKVMLPLFSGSPTSPSWIVRVP